MNFVYYFHFIDICQTLKILKDRYMKFTRPPKAAFLQWHRALPYFCPLSQFFCLCYPSIFISPPGWKVRPKLCMMASSSLSFRCLSAILTLHDDCLNLYLSCTGNIIMASISRVDGSSKGLACTLQRRLLHETSFHFSPASLWCLLTWII